MTGKEVLNNFLFEAIKAPPEGGGIALFDLDDSLVLAQNIFIYRKNEDGAETKLTPDEFAKDTDKEKKKYDFREFRDPKKIHDSITAGKPIWKNLRIFDAYVNAGWDVGILTARALEDVIYSALQKWLMFRDKSGNLNPIKDKLSRNLVFAVSDDIKKYEGINSFEKKANVILTLSKKYSKIIMLDDDRANLEAIKKMAKNNGIEKKIVLIPAWT